MATYKKGRCQITDIGHPEHNSCVVRFLLNGERLGVIDTGGWYEVTRWNHVEANWSGRVLGRYDSFSEALDQARLSLGDTHRDWER